MTKGRALVALLAVLALVVGFVVGRERAQRVPDLSRFDELIEREARAAGVDPALLRAVVAAESGGDPEAVSPAGAVGLCQLMPATADDEARRLGLGDVSDRLTDPEINTRIGATYLGRLIRRFGGDEVWALAAYNAGATNARRWQRRAPDVSSRDAVMREGFSETRGYVARVMRFRAAYER